MVGCLGRGELELVQSVIEVATGQKILLSPMLHNLPVMQYENTVSLADGGEPMSYNQGGASLEKPLQCSLNEVLCLAVDVCCGLVEN